MISVVEKAAITILALVTGNSCYWAQDYPPSQPLWTIGSDQEWSITELPMSVDQVTCLIDFSVSFPDERLLCLLPSTVHILRLGLQHMNFWGRDTIQLISPYI